MIIFIQRYFPAKNRTTAPLLCVVPFALCMSEKIRRHVEGLYSAGSSAFPALFRMQVSGRIPPAARIPAFVFCALPICVFT